VRISYRIFLESGSSEYRTFLDRLMECGICADPSSTPDLPEVAFFRSPVPALYEHLKERAGHSRRVLAVSVNDHPPQPGVAWGIVSAGATDVIWWQDGQRTPAEIKARLERWQAIDLALESDLVHDHMVGGSRAWVAVLRELVEIALFSTNSCLIQGESGTGKELVARLIHTLDPRPDKRELVIADCSTLVPELSGSEFFGHERGAYTGAVGGRDGAFALANGGTLFLDEVGELPHSLQAQLLRVIQEGSYKRVGGNEWRKTSFRLVCATNRDLASEVAAGRFRGDLYHRVAGAVVKMPPLRERRADILPLARHFLEGSLPERKEAAITLSPAVESWLLERNYPGNIRELRQVISRMLRRHAGNGPFTPGDVAPEDRPPDFDAPPDWHAEPLEHAIQGALRCGARLKEISRETIACAIRLALEGAGGNLQGAAQRLGVTVRALQIRRAVERERGAPSSLTRAAKTSS
jgi:transcriptional regulator with GAF, ATPase, and Fis domain